MHLELIRRALMNQSTFSRRLARLGACALLTVAPPVLAQVQPGAPRLTLRGLLDSVATTHPSIEAARLRVRAARGGRSAAGAFANPLVTYQVENTQLPRAGSVPGLDRETMTMVTLPLEPIYQRGARVRESNALVHAAESDARGVLQSVEREAAHAYYRVARAQAKVEALLDVVAWLDTVVAYNRTRVQEGVTAEADLIRAGIERDRANVEATTQRAELARARAAAGAFLASGTVASVVVPTQPLDAPVDASIVVTTRPDLVAAQARVEASQAAVGFQRRSIFRELGATIGSKQTMGTSSMIAGLSLPVPLFDQNRGSITRASAERDAAARDLTAVTRVATAEVQGARDAVAALSGEVNRLAAGGPLGFLARADDAQRIALGAYREGAASLLQVLDAARARSEARMAYYDLLIDQHEAVIDLLFAAGQDIRAAITRSNSDER